MGTNYYVETNKCEHCGRSDVLHIGKSCGGWEFQLHVIPEKQLNSLLEWEIFLKSNECKIFDDYRAEYTPKEMLEVIKDRGGYTLPLWRADIDGTHCIGHEEYCDLIKTDFF